MSDKIYLDDLRLGQTFVTGQAAVSAAEIKEFAGKFDPQPFHLDEAAAEHTFFGGLAASGWHTAALTMRLLVTSDLRLADGIIGGGGELSWPKPTRPGDVLHVEAEVIEITPSRSRPERGTIVVHSRTLNQDGDVVQSSKMRLVVPRRV